MTAEAEVLGQCLARWDFRPETLAHVRNGANSVYEFHAHGSRFFLRITMDQHRNREQLEAELDFVRFLAARGLMVACPLPSSRGNFVETFADGTTDVRHAVVFAGASGRHFRYFSNDIDRTLFRVWGRAMGALHINSREFVPGHFSRPVWSAQDTTSCDADRIPIVESEARREHECILAWLASRAATRENWGLIHGDFERTNFVLDHGTLRLFDFDDACYHWYVADIAHALWAFRNAPPSDRSRFLEWFLQGYREHCSLDHDIREQLSWYVRLRTLSLFIDRLRDDAHADWASRTRLSLGTPVQW